MSGRALGRQLSLPRVVSNRGCCRSRRFRATCPCWSAATTSCCTCVWEEASFSAALTGLCVDHTCVPGEGGGHCPSSSSRLDGVRPTRRVCWGHGPPSHLEPGGDERRPQRLGGRRRLAQPCLPARLGRCSSRTAPESGRPKLITGRWECPRRSVLLPPAGRPFSLPSDAAAVAAPAKPAASARLCCSRPGSARLCWPPARSLALCVCLRALLHLGALVGGE